jgi:hypothetical protein
MPHSRRQEKAKPAKARIRRAMRFGCDQIAVLPQIRIPFHGLVMLASDRFVVMAAAVARIAFFSKAPNFYRARTSRDRGTWSAK